MGWWNASADGRSLQREDTGLYWGDGPADVIDAAIREICDLFIEQFGRKPSEAELIAGMHFSAGIVDDE